MALACWAVSRSCCDRTTPAPAFCPALDRDLLRADRSWTGVSYSGANPGLANQFSLECLREPDHDAVLVGGDCPMESALCDHLSHPATLPEPRMASRVLDLPARRADGAHVAD